MESPFARRVESAAPPPPSYVRYIPQGTIHEAWRSAEIPHSGTSRFRSSAAQKAGSSYEKRVREWAYQHATSDSIEVSPWFCFVDDSHKRHYCQPDLLLVSPNRVVVVEVKLRWSLDAWWQLRHLYLPVLEVALRKPIESFVPLCICKSFDPAFPSPEPIALRTDLNVCTPSTLNVMLVH